VGRLKLMAFLQFGRRMVRTGLVDYFHDKRNRPDIRRTNPYSISMEDISSVWGMMSRKVPLHTDGNMVPEFEERIQGDCRVMVLPKFLRSIAPI